MAQVRLLVGSFLAVCLVALLLPGTAAARQAQTVGSPNVDTVTYADTLLYPPDTMGDVGPTQILVAANGRIRSFTKTTGAADLGGVDLTLDAFFDSVRAGHQVTNPRVRFDRRTNKWYVAAINLTLANRVLLAVSNSAVIDGSTIWTYFSHDNDRRAGGLPAGDQCLADFPTLGVDEDALYVGVNQYCGPTFGSVDFESTSGFVINKASVQGAGPAVVTTFHELAVGTGVGPFTPQGVDNFDSNTNEGYFIGVDNSALGMLQVVRITDPGGTPTRSASLPVTVAGTDVPIGVPHPGSTSPLEAQDDRLSQAVIRNGRLWTTHHIGVDASGVASATASRNAMRWYELQDLTTTPAVRQQGTVFDSAATNPASYFMGSIMVSGQGHVALGSTIAGAATFVNAAVTGRLASDALGQMNGAPQVYTANASATYNRESPTQAWGGYSYTSLDPSDDMTMWTLQQYVQANDSYALRLVRLQAPPPASVTSVTPNVVTTGRTGLTLTVTGSSSAGSGFFDPGTGFANRLAAAFTGSGVTITAITVNSPTQVTLTVDTTAAGGGAFPLVITNPDGQNSTLASALTVQANQAPVATGDAHSVRENLTLSVAAPGVLANDADGNNDPMTAQPVTLPAHGTLTLNANGSFVYVPAAGFAGADSFTYQANDGAALSAPATVSITVVPNATPVGGTDAYQVALNTPRSVAAPGVLANDSDADGDPITVSIATHPSHGTVSLSPNGAFVYTPAANYSGLDVFTYIVSDAWDSSAPVTVTLTVAANALPVGAADAYSTAFEAALTVPAPGVLGNDSDADGQPLTALVETTPGHGTLTLSANGGFSYTPSDGFAGTDTFTYRPNDGLASGAPTTVTITVAQPTVVQPPAGLVAANVSGNTVTLRWTAPGVGPSPTGYVLEGGINPSEVLESIPTGSAAPIFTFVAPTGSFYARIHAMNGSERSAASNEIRIHVNVPVVPSAPAGLVSLVNGSSLGLAWRNTFAGGAPSALVLDVTGSIATSIPFGPGEAFAFDGVPPGTYTLRLRAANGGGASPASDPVTVTFPAACSGVPQTPVDVLVYRLDSVGFVVWNPATAGPAPMAYVVNVTGAFVGSFPTTGRTVNGVVGPGTYNITVTAVNACGASAPSSPQVLAVP